MFENKIRLSSPTMHGEELHYVKEAYEKNLIFSIGENIDNVECRPIWKPMHMQPLFSGNTFISAKENGSQKNSVAEDLFERGLCLPSDIKMTDTEQDAIMDLIRSCFQ